MPQQLTRFLLVLSLALAGCASVPETYHGAESHAWQHPEQTITGEFFADNAPPGASPSGVLLLSHPRDAFLARYGFAAQAEKTLDFQYYLWKGDTTGILLLHQAFLAADRGVKVRILIDDIYHTKRDHSYAVIDSHPNIQVRVYNPIVDRGMGRNFNYLFRKSQLNHRMHNKIFLVDSAVTVLGGRNIGDDYFGIDPNLNFADMDVLAVGDAAKNAGDAYDLYWNSPKAAPISEISKDIVQASDLADMRAEIDANLDRHMADVPYAVPLSRAALLPMLEDMMTSMEWVDSEIIIDSLDRFEGGNESAFVLLNKRLMKQAKDNITVQTAYLIPTEEGIEAVSKLTARGIRVRIMTNSMLSNNHLSVHAFYMKHRKALIEAGVELYELRADPELLEYYKQTEDRVADSHAGMHTKSYVVDDRFSMIGSFNMDPRSRIWNSEIGLLIDSEAFAARVLYDMNQEFEPGNAYRVTLDDKGKLLWTADGPNGVETWTHDPGASVWKRMTARIIGWLPIENEL